VTARVQRWFWVQLAHWCHVFRQTDTAIKYYGLALESTPDDPQILASMGYELLHAGRKREALAAFNRAVAIRPNWAEVHFGRAMLLQEFNDHEAALETFDLALAANPDHDRAWYGKALSLIALQRKDEAVAPLERNTRLQPMSPYGWYQLARVQFDRGKPDNAQRIIDHLATFEPKVAAQLARETGLVAPPKP
jgi:tetratricopeptide (TPR) repeat protein